MLGLLQAAPLVHQPVDTLDLKTDAPPFERAPPLASGSTSCATCTTRRLRGLLTDGCRMLHYSGHGFSYVDRNNEQSASGL